VMRIDRSAVRPPAVTIRFVSVYDAPAVPPLTHTVARVVVFDSAAFVIPVGAVHVDALIVSAPSQAAQSIT